MVSLVFDACAGHRLLVAGLHVVQVGSPACAVCAPQTSVSVLTTNTDLSAIRHFASTQVDPCAAARSAMQVWTVKAGGTISDRLPVRLPEQGVAEPNEGAPPGAYEDIVVQASWLPGSSTHVAVTLPHGLYVYDLSTDARQPILRITAGSAAKLLASAAVGELLVQVS